MNAVLKQAVTAADAKAAFAKTSLREFRWFVAYVWPVLEPGVKYQDNWHIDAICEYLQAVKDGQVKRLIINMPFRMLKSTLVSQMFPPFEWLHNPSEQYLTSSYAKDLATRDAVNSRRIMESTQYAELMTLLPESKRWVMTGDQNVKTRYENDKRGMRTVTSTDAASTGFGGSRLIVDDPISAKMADSPLEIAKSIEWWRGTMATRFNNPGSDAAIVTHQRLNEKDLTGYLMSEEGNWDVLRLPMRYDPQIISISSIPRQYVDARTKPGELMFPNRLDEQSVAVLERSLGKYHTSAQLQQNPAPRAGNLFKRDDWRYWRVAPQLKSLDVVISVDCTFKDVESADYVSMTVWGFEKREQLVTALAVTQYTGGKVYLLDRVYGQMGFMATIRALRGLRAKWDATIATLVEDKANGSAVIETLGTEIQGVVPVNPDGGKYSRAAAVQPQQEAHQIVLPDPSLPGYAWVHDYVENMTRFPGTPDDDTDSTSQALNWNRTRPGYSKPSPLPSVGGVRIMT